MTKYNTEISTNVSGVSSSIALDPGIWNIFVTATSWSSGTTTLQVSHNNVTFFNLKDSLDEDVTFTADGAEKLNGGLFLRASNNKDISGFYLVAKESF